MSNSPVTIEFFFDFSSPWTYMAYTQVERICRETGAQLVWRPFYVAAVFRAVNHNVEDMRARPVPAKLEYYKTDMRRWAHRLEIKIARPPVYGGGSKPLNSARALRGAFLAIDNGRASEYAGLVFRAYWEELRDIAEKSVLIELAEQARIDSADFAERVDGPECRARLDENTTELIQRGCFGTPTLFVNRMEMFFGNDRLDFVHNAARPGRV